MIEQAPRWAAAEVLNGCSHQRLRRRFHHHKRRAYCTRSSTSADLSGDPDLNRSEDIPIGVPGLGVALEGAGSEHVLVLHDWMGDHTIFDQARPYLDGESFSYAFVDLRGYGDSRSIPGRYTVDEIAADSLDVANRLGWTRFHAVGHSMTAMAIQRLAAMAQDRIKSAVVICPMSAAGSTAPDEALAFFASTIDDDDAFCRLACYVAGGLSPAWGRSKLRENRQRVDPAAQREYLKLFRASFADEVRGVQTPFFVIIGDKDPGLDERAMQDSFLAWYPNAELRVIRNCGHYPMQECPPYFATVLEACLRSEALPLAPSPAG